ncbi:MAG: 30S ribosomal protein S1, partial [Chloroflexi bacterium]|nr:30S ribosomal protein S1 [Chloroflexota bacterium]
MEEHYEEQMPDNAEVSGEEELAEQERQDALTMGDLLDEAENPFTQPKRGQVVEGIVVQIDPGAILVDIGAKLDGFIHPNEVAKIQQDPDSSPKVGERILVYVVQPANKDGHAVLSLSRAQAERDWREAEQRFKDNEILDLQVMGYNKGGLIVRLGEVRGFIPASQLERRIPSSNRAEDRMKQLSKLVGQDIKLKIVEMDRSNNRLIMSERLAMREWREQQRDTLMDDLREGEVRRGRVSGLSDFGAFVDIGGADGLVHLSELSWDQVAHPRNVVQVGEEVDVYVLNVDRERRRIALSIKRTKPEPWGDIHQRYQIGQIISGEVTKLASFGAFVRLEEGIEGLAHISELSTQRIQHPKEVVQEGEKYDFRIIRIDSARRRMRLSLKQLVEEETPDLDGEDVPTPELL